MSVTHCEIDFTKEAAVNLNGDLIQLRLDGEQIKSSKGSDCVKIVVSRAMLDAETQASIPISTYLPMKSPEFEQTKFFQSYLDESFSNMKPDNNPARFVGTLKELDRVFKYDR